MVAEGGLVRPRNLPTLRHAPPRSLNTDGVSTTWT